jgi:hypothetical protein
MSKTAVPSSSDQYQGGQAGHESETDFSKCPVNPFKKEDAQGREGHEKEGWKDLQIIKRQPYFC